MKIKKILPAGLVLLLVLVWYSAISDAIEAPLAYKEHLKKAKQYEKEERYQYAIEEYEAAIAAKPDNLELYEKQIKAYEKLGNTDAVLAKCDYIIQNFEDNREAYQKELDYYVKKQEYETAAELAIAAKQAYPKDEKIAKVYQQLQNTYSQVYASYPQMSGIYNGCVHVTDEGGQSGILYETGEVRTSVVFDAVGFYSNVEDSDIQIAPVCVDEKYYYMDENGYKALVNEEGYDDLGEVSEGVMTVGKKGSYGYAVWNLENRSFAAKTKLKWHYAGKMYNGVAAVYKDGKWALINSEYKEITKYKYSEIVLDEFGICSRNSVAFVREGEKDKYKLIRTTDGKDITKAEFDDVKPFAGGDLAAVCKDGCWGYIDASGKLQIKYQYEDAKSFSDKYAPVYSQGSWGYIDKENELVIDYQFEDAKQFSVNGRAPVVLGGNWTIIQPYIY